MTMTDTLEEEDRYETDQTSIAAYLVYNGVDCDEMEWVNGVCTFFFDHTERVTELLYTYVSGKAQVEPNQYSHVFGQVRRQMFELRDRNEGRGSGRRRTA